MKKRLLCLGLLLVMACSFAACGVQNDNTTEEPTYDNSIVDEQALAEFIKSFDNYGDYVDNQLIVCLTEEASFEYIFHDYTAEDFPEIGAVSVDPLDGPWGDTPGIVDKIRQCLSEDPSGNTIPEHFKHHKRMFCITLDKQDKENVLRAIFILRQREDIYIAEPNGIWHLD